MAGDHMKNANHGHITEQLSGPWQRHWAQPSRFSLEEPPIADWASGQQWRRSGRREEDSRSGGNPSPICKLALALWSSVGLQVSPEASALFQFASHKSVSLFTDEHRGPVWRNPVQPRSTWGRVDPLVAHFDPHTQCCSVSLQLLARLWQQQKINFPQI